jgi:3'(2'), 5'-bisphosphate nucleotidase
MNSPWRDHPLSREIAAALEAVRRAGRLCRTVQAGLDPATISKKDRSPVTVADFGSQAVVCRVIGEAFPPDPVIGEEDSAALREPGNRTVLEQVVAQVGLVAPGSGADEVCAWIDRGGAHAYSDRFWTLDPIDGTKGFLRGEQYAISLGLIESGEIVAAVLGCPNLGPVLQGDRAAGTVFAALKGAGAWVMPMFGGGEPEPIAVSSEQDPSLIRFCESVEAAHSSHGDAARIAERLAIRAESARLDSQAKYAVVARGEAEAYLRLPRDVNYREKIWDHAGGVLVVTEAGGRVTDIRGRDLDFRRGSQLENNLGVIVTNGYVHDAVLDAIGDLGIGRFDAPAER